MPLFTTRQAASGCQPSRYCPGLLTNASGGAHLQQEKLCILDMVICGADNAPHRAPSRTGVSMGDAYQVAGRRVLHAGHDAVDRVRRHHAAHRGRDHRLHVLHDCRWGTSWSCSLLVSLSGHKQ